MEISTDGTLEDEVELVERDSGVQRRVALSRFEAGWLGGVLSQIQLYNHGGLYASLRGGSRRLEIYRRQNNIGNS